MKEKPAIIFVRKNILRPFLAQKNFVQDFFPRRKRYKKMIQRFAR